VTAPSLVQRFPQADAWQAHGKRTGERTFACDARCVESPAAIFAAGTRWFVREKIIVFDDEHRDRVPSFHKPGRVGGEQAYNSRHFSRVDRLLRATYLVDLTLAAMTGIGADDHQDVDTAAVLGKPSTPSPLDEQLRKEEEEEEEKVLNTTPPRLSTHKHKSGGKRKSAAAAANGNSSAKKTSATKRTRAR
jgi:hypothetical protein